MVSVRCIRVVCVHGRWLLTLTLCCVVLSVRWIGENVYDFVFQSSRIYDSRAHELHLIFRRLYPFKYPTITSHFSSRSERSHPLRLFQTQLRQPHNSLSLPPAHIAPSSQILQHDYFLSGKVQGGKPKHLSHRQIGPRGP